MARVTVGINRLPVRPRSSRRGGSIWRQWNSDFARIGAGLADEVEAVIEKLTKNNEPHAVAGIAGHAIQTADKRLRIADAFAGVGLSCNAAANASLAYVFVAGSLSTKPELTIVLADQRGV